MAVWALSDPHLSLSAPDKGMEVFGPQWKEHMPRIARSTACSTAMGLSSEVAALSR